MGFAIAANSMVSNVIGQDRREEVMVLLNRIILLAFGTAAVMVAINLLFPVQLLGPLRRTNSSSRTRDQV